MLGQTQGAVFTALALGQLFGLVLADVVTLALTFVAGLAKVSGAPAEPLSHTAAVAALEVYKIATVSLTALLAVLDANAGAARADELFGLVDLLLLLRADAVLLAAEVGVFALEALVVSQLVHGELLQVVVVLVLRVQQPGVLVQGLVLDPLKRLLHDLLLELVDFAGLLADGRALGRSYFQAFALGAV